jgi:putative ATPase
MDELFDKPPAEGYTPLADKMRPQTIDELVGQQHLLGEDMPLRAAIESNNLPSIIFWGPPGSGKTSIASVIAKTIDAHFHWFSAILSGVKDLREIIDLAQKQRRLSGKKTILFVDEIHRFNKAQQDAFLPHIERGTIILVGATTENPSFEIISPLLSRTKVYVLEPLTEDDIGALINRTLTDEKRGLGSLKLKVNEEAKNFIIASSDGDARRMYNTLEIASSLIGPKNKKLIDLKLAEGALQKKSLAYDKLGEEHYNIISAFIKSMRGSNPDAALYWMARMLESGEDPLFISRRMVIFASEDIGNADPQAIQVAVSTMQAFNFVGMPEGWIPLAQCATYLATAPKSKSSYLAYKQAKTDAVEHGTLPVPKHIRNAPTKLMEDLGYGEGYKNPQKYSDNFVKQQYLPDKLDKKVYYRPSENGYERHISERLKKWRN